MEIPSAMHIEAAAAQMKTLPLSVKQGELRELLEFGHERAQQLGARSVNVDLMTGYLLGLETARVFLAGLPAYAASKVEF
jgi:hypothetical protein